MREVAYLPSRPANGELLDAEGHLDGGLLDGDAAEGLGNGRVGEGVADGYAANAGEGRRFSPAPAASTSRRVRSRKRKDVVNLGLGVAAVAVEQDYRLSSPDAAPEDAADGDGTKVAIVVECGDEQFGTAPRGPHGAPGYGRLLPRRGGQGPVAVSSRFRDGVAPRAPRRRRTGKSSWSASVASSRKRSWMAPSVSGMRVVGRSILLITTMGRRPWAMAGLEGRSASGESGRPRRRRAGGSRRPC